MYFKIALLSYIIDKIFGEFKFITHPVIFMGRYIKFFEKHFYKDSIFRGFLLSVSLLIIVFIICFMIDYFISNLFVLAIITSMGIASNMLYSSVKNVIFSQNPKNEIAMLVSRDTKNMSQSDIYKASIETYAENLSDGVVAPLFYLIFFGIYGIFIYKAINTLDSMVGYRNEKYENFGKFSAKLDDLANFIPSRITALIISFLFFSLSSIKALKYASLHESPNAGYPISSMAGALNISLGGDTSYFGKMKKKPYFGEGRREILKNDLLKALSIQTKFDILIIIILIFLSFN